MKPMQSTLLHSLSVQTLLNSNTVFIPQLNFKNQSIIIGIKKGHTPFFYTDIPKEYV